MKKKRISKTVISIILVLSLIMGISMAYADDDFSDIRFDIDSDDGASTVFLSKEKLTYKEWIDSPGQERVFCALSYYEIVNYLLSNNEQEKANSFYQVAKDAVQNDTIYYCQWDPWARCVFYGNDNKYIMVDYIPPLHYNQFTGGNYEGSESFSVYSGKTDGTYHVFKDEKPLLSDHFVKAVSTNYSDVASLIDEKYSIFDESTEVANNENEVPEQEIEPKGIKDQEAADICADIEKGLATFMSKDTDEYRVYYDDQEDVFYAYCVCDLANVGIAGQVYDGDTSVNDIMKRMLGSEIFMRTSLCRITKQTHKNSSFVYAYVNGIYDSFGDYDLVDDWSKYPKDGKVVLYAISIDREADAMDESNFKVYDPWFGDNKIHIK